ncbi:MAG: RNA polymerase sigma factor (sigma-70 family) [Flavobacteriaceae bacterium]|jgi:RNA polymerase sigma factor (sigma-70 family)
MSEYPEDHEIIDLFNQGGASVERAFGILVAKHGGALYAQIRRITKNHDHTNDVLQNVLIKIYQNLAKFNQDSALYTWMYRIARNETLNFLDKEKLRTGVDIDDAMLEIIAGHSGLDTMTSQEIWDVLQNAIATLPEKQAIVFQLKYFEELKYSEISAKLNTSEGALKASFHHAKQKIQTFILNQLNL